MEKIKPGKFVELVYDVYEVVPGGEDKLVHQVDPADPEKLVFGVTKGVIRPLEEALDGLGEGDKFDVTVSAADAFGPYDPEQVVTLEKEIFEVDGKFDGEHVKAGAVIPMMTAQGFQVSGLVKEVNADSVVMDFNHPLAGKDVRFAGSVKTVREATPEEIKPAEGCGCGCDHEGCDSNECGGGCCH